MTPIAWIPVLVCVVSLSAYFTYRCNQDRIALWFFLSWLAWSIPTWTVITAYSKNIIFDGILYDMIAVTTFAIVTAFLMSKGGFHFTIGQIAGICIMLLGIGIFKISSI